MSTLDDRITAFGGALSTARKNIIAAINNKGVSCAETEKLSALPDYIRGIANTIDAKVIVYPTICAGNSDTSRYRYYAILGTSKTVSSTNAKDWTPYKVTEDGMMLVSVNWTKAPWAGRDFQQTGLSSGAALIYIDGTLAYKLAPGGITGTDDGVRIYDMTFPVKVGQEIIVQGIVHSADNSDARSTFSTFITLTKLI